MVRACAKSHEHAVYIFSFKYSAYSIYYVGTLETVWQYAKSSHY